MNKENCALNLVDEIILYYDAGSKKHQTTDIFTKLRLLFGYCILTKLFKTDNANLSTLDLPVIYTKTAGKLIGIGLCVGTVCTSERNGTGLNKAVHFWTHLGQVTLRE